MGKVNYKGGGVEPVEVGEEVITHPGFGQQCVAVVMKVCGFNGQFSCYDNQDNIQLLLSFKQNFNGKNIELIL